MTFLRRLACIPLSLRTTAAAGLLLLSSGASYAAGSAYYISYLWRQDKAGIENYRKKVAYILGRDVAEKLQVVRLNGRYGLVYARNGGLESARAVARSHSRQLAKGGLEPAVPVRARDCEVPKTAAAPPPAAAPAKTAEAPPPPLETGIENYIKDLRRSGLVKSDERTAWIVYDLTSEEKLAGINEDLPMQSASLIKPFIALAYLHEVEAGRRPYNSQAREQMERMIQESDNAAANWAIRRLGGPAAVQRLLKKYYGSILKDIRIVEYIPASGRTYRNKASVHDYSRFLYSLWNDGLPRSGEIKRLMNLPKPNRLYTSVPGVPDDTEVYDKTGTTSHLCGDMGILVARRADGARFPYIVVGIVEKDSSARHYFDWMRDRGDVIRHVSGMVYDEIAAKHLVGASGRLSAESKPGAKDAGRKETADGHS